jgi:hypothetical protein
MKDYTYQDMLKMQEDAAFRVREMKKRATLVMDEDEQISQSPKPEIRKGLLDTLLQDSDTVLVVALLMLVMSEKNDYLINLALMYILL